MILKYIFVTTTHFHDLFIGGPIWINIENLEYFLGHFYGVNKLTLLRKRRFAIPGFGRLDQALFLRHASWREAAV